MRPITIKKLIKLIEEPECEYLDFKLDYSGKNGDIVKDILSLANSRCNQKHRFLIFGVSDDGKVRGIAKSLRRKTQSEVIDILRNAGINKIPPMQLYSLAIDNIELDVLQITIEDASEQPYFLNKDFDGTVHAGTFYERVRDTNRPIVNEVIFEAIYRKKFGLDLTPLQRFNIYLKDKSGWRMGFDERHIEFFYYAQHPEFTIFLYDSGELYLDPWATKFPDSKAHKQKFFIKYHNTLLMQLAGVFSDGDRYLTVSPKRYDYYDPKFKEHFLGFYFLKDSFEFLLNEMIQEVYFQHCPRRAVIGFPLYSSERAAKRILNKVFQRDSQEVPFFKLDDKTWVGKNLSKMEKVN